jgi:hypothetical protein
LFTYAALPERARPPRLPAFFIETTFPRRFDPPRALVVFRDLDWVVPRLRAEAVREFPLPLFERLLELPAREEVLAVFFEVDRELLELPRDVRLCALARLLVLEREVDPRPAEALRLLDFCADRLLARVLLPRAELDLLRVPRALLLPAERDRAAVLPVERDRPRAPPRLLPPEALAFSREINLLKLLFSPPAVVS